MSPEGSLAAAEMGWPWQRTASRSRSVCVAMQGSVATWLQMLGKPGQEEKESRGVSQELSKDTGAREAVFPGICG